MRETTYILCICSYLEELYWVNYSTLSSQGFFMLSIPEGLETVKSILKYYILCLTGAICFLFCLGKVSLEKQIV